MSSPQPPLQFIRFRLHSQCHAVKLKNDDITRNMANFGEKTPLLLAGDGADEDDVDVDFTDQPDCQVVNRKFRNLGPPFGGNLNSPLLYNVSYAPEDGTLSVSDLGRIAAAGDADQASPDVVCVFVVAFDTRAGNIVEWCIPEDMDLEGIEFRAMTSGSHRIKTDFIYFKKDNLYGLSCFENMPVDSQIERGARMKSVGILAPSYRLLHHHKPFLEAEVSRLLKAPGSYEELTNFYNANKGILQPHADQDSISPLTSNIHRLNITHPAGCFTQFVRFFGEQIFSLWKFMLLQKRILLFSQPPIGVVCYRVYCCTCLTSSPINGISSPPVNTLFYVNVSDVEMLEASRFFVACTTEKILESKPHLYDVYVDNQNVITRTPLLQQILKPTSTDKTNFDQLCKMLQQRQNDNYDVSGSELEADIFLRFFRNLNAGIFDILLDVSSSQEKQVTPDHFRAMRLDPSADRAFLTELVELHGIDADIPPDNPCCPT